jgi:hypothetical protein
MKQYDGIIGNYAEKCNQNRQLLYFFFDKQKNKLNDFIILRNIIRDGVTRDKTKNPKTILERLERDNKDLYEQLKYITTKYKHMDVKTEEYISVLEYEIQTINKMLNDPKELKREFYRTQTYHTIPITCNKFNTLYSIVKDTVEETSKAIKQYNRLYGKEHTFEQIFGEGDEGIKRYEEHRVLRESQGQQFVPYFVNGRVQSIVNATNQTATKSDDITKELDDLTTALNTELGLLDKSSIEHQTLRKTKDNKGNYTDNDSNVISGGFVNMSFDGAKSSGLEFLIVVNTRDGILKYNYSNDDLIIADIPGSVYGIDFPSDIRLEKDKTTGKYLPPKLKEKKAYAIPIELFEFMPNTNTEGSSSSVGVAAEPVSKASSGSKKPKK